MNPDEELAICVDIASNILTAMIPSDSNSRKLASAFMDLHKWISEQKGTLPKTWECIGERKKPRTYGSEA